MNLLKYLPVSLKNMYIQRASQRFSFASESGRFQIILDGNQRVTDFVFDAYSYPEVVDMINAALREREISILDELKIVLLK